MSNRSGYQKTTVVMENAELSDRITLTDVANHAGVSMATASMALSGSPKIFPETADRIRDVAEKIGYVPLRRRTPKQAKPQSSHDQVGQKTIAIIGIHIDYGRFPIYTRLLQLVTDLIAGRKDQVVSINVDTHTELMPILRQGDYSGALMLWQDADEYRTNAREVQACIPCVRMLGSFVPGSSIDHVTCDNHRVGELAAQYLWDQGHRHVANIHPQLAGNPVFKTRAFSFAQTFEDLGGKVQTHFYRGNIQAQELASRLTSEGQCPTAVFAGEDRILEQFDLMFRQLGLLPGKDIQLVGCNNERHRLEEIEPRPVSVDLQLRNIAQQSLELLILRQTRPPTTRMQVLVEPKLSIDLA